MLYDTPLGYWKFLAGHSIFRMGCSLLGASLNFPKTFGMSHVTQRSFFNKQISQRVTLHSDDKYHPTP